MQNSKLLWGAKCKIIVPYEVPFAPMNIETNQVKQKAGWTIKSLSWRTFCENQLRDC